MPPITLPFSVFNVLSSLAAYGGFRLYQDVAGKEAVQGLTPEEVVEVMNRVQAVIKVHRRKWREMS